MKGFLGSLRHNYALLFALGPLSKVSPPLRALSSRRARAPGASAYAVQSLPKGSCVVPFWAPKKALHEEALGRV